MTTMVPYQFMLPLMQHLMAPTQPAPFSTAVEGAPDLKSYPSSEDANFANKYDFSYGTPNARFATGHEVGVLNAPGEGRTLDDILAPDNRHLVASDTPMPGVSDIMTRGQLAANRIPLAALGFDAAHMAYDPQPIQHPNVGGAYSHWSDNMYANDQWDKNPSTIVHESIHRGINHLRNDPSLKNVFSNIPSEESVVRYLMNTKAGNPEQGQGDAGDDQIKVALKSFNDPMWGTTFKSMVDKLNDAASKKLMSEQPVMGPR